MAELCVHDMTPGTCGWCDGRDGGELEEKNRRHALLSVKGVVNAGYPGRCACCGEWYAVGTPVRFSGRVGGWVAACCLDETGGVIIRGDDTGEAR